MFLGFDEKTLELISTLEILVVLFPSFSPTPKNIAIERILISTWKGKILNTFTRGSRVEEEKRGFFGKIQEKYEAYKKAAEQRRHEKFEDEKRKAVDEINKWMNKSLRDIVSEPVELKPLPMGVTFGVAGAFITKDNTPIVSYITLESPWGTSKVMVYPMVYLFGSFVDHSVPTSMITKRMSAGFMSSQRVLIPFEAQPNLQFDAKTIWKSKSGWNPLLEVMNTDKRLISALSSLSNESAINLSPKRWLTYKIEDKNERDMECLCQIVPYKNLTFIGIRVLGLSVKDQVKNVINAVRMFRGHIVSYGHTGPATGHVAQDWIKIPIFIVADYFSPIKEIFTPEPTEEIDVAEIDYFGAKRDRALELIKAFNTIRRRDPDNWNALVTIRQRLAEKIDQDPNRLLKALESKEVAVQAAAAMALGGHPSPDIIAILGQATQSSDTFLACSALDSLGYTGQKTVTPFLTSALNDPIEQKRAVAGYALSRLADENAIDALTTALDDEERRVQKIAAFALLKIRVQQTLENRATREDTEEALKRFLTYLDADKMASLATGKEKDVQIDVKDIYRGQVTEELLKLLLRRFLVVVEARKKTFAGDKKQAFSYAVDAETAEEAKNKVVEEFNKQHAIEGFTLDGPVGSPFDMTAAGAEISQIPLGTLMQPVWLKDKK